ncbi:DNA-binding transcriptional regulator, XRE-family HTH domain [Burkholderia sp. GAS332]|nr:DNA-binding transcriptional regulator, XRE-family HTH domain [Burkholderia sp. GAS332]
MKTLKTLAERLVWARTEAKLSQSQLAKIVGVSQSAIGNLESGARLTSRKIAAIATALDVNAYWLSDNKGSPKAQSGEASEAAAESAPPTPIPSPAVQRLLRMLAERSDEEIDRITTGLELLLGATKVRAGAEQKRISFTVGEPNTANASRRKV